MEPLAVTDQFDARQEHIRVLRASERKLYLQVTELFSFAVDYQPSSEESSRFFRLVQNKLHFAATGLTAAGIVETRADREHPSMSLTSWSGVAVRKADVTVAKNYLRQEEIVELGRLVLLWLDFAESHAAATVRLQDWTELLAEFLQLHGLQVLPDSAALDVAQRERADLKAQAEYKLFSARRRALAAATRKRRHMTARAEAQARAKKRKGSPSEKQ